MCIDHFPSEYWTIHSSIRLKWSIVTIQIQRVQFMEAQESKIEWHRVYTTSLRTLERSFQVRSSTIALSCNREVILVDTDVFLYSLDLEAEVSETLIPLSFSFIQRYEKEANDGQWNQNIPMITPSQELAP